nr:hypothetical protein [Desulfobaculum xiamenense]
MRVFAVIIPLVLLGLADDAWNLPARSRLPVHLLLGGLTCALFGPVPLPFAPDMGTPGLIVQWAVTIVGTAALINFYNFMDGLDGLVAGTALVQMFFLAIQLDQPLWLLLAAGIAGFLPWNWPRASIFMGDAASTTLGACAAIAIVGCPTRGLAAEALAVTLPLTVDATYTILRRLSRRENIFHAHRSHIYQRLHNTAGWSHARVTTLYIALTILCALAITAFADYGPATCIALCLALLPLAELHIRRFASKTS